MTALIWIGIAAAGLAAWLVLACLVGWAVGSLLRDRTPLALVVGWRGPLPGELDGEGR